MKENYNNYKNLYHSMSWFAIIEMLIISLLILKIVGF